MLPNLRFPLLAAAVVASIATTDLEPVAPAPADAAVATTATPLWPVDASQRGAQDVVLRLAPTAHAAATGAELVVQVNYFADVATGDLTVTIEDALGELDGQTVDLAASGATTEVTFTLDDVFVDCLPSAGSDWCFESYTVRVTPTGATGEYEVFADLTVEGVTDSSLLEVAISTSW